MSECDTADNLGSCLLHQFGELPHTLATADNIVEKQNLGRSVEHNGVEVNLFVGCITHHVRLAAVQFRAFAIDDDMSLGVGGPRAFTHHLREFAIAHCVGAVTTGGNTCEDNVLHFGHTQSQTHLPCCPFLCCRPAALETEDVVVGHLCLEACMSEVAVGGVCV